MRRIVERIRQESELRFVVVDGAQAINHVPLDLDADYCDFMVAGCHKWVGSSTPLGVGFFGRRQSRQGIGKSINRWMNRGTLKDPLLTFSRELQTGRGSRFGETVAISPLLYANAALAEPRPKPDGHPSESPQTICGIAAQFGWKFVDPGEDFRARILLLRAPPRVSDSSDQEALRRRLQDAGVIASTYRRGLVRISLPTGALCDVDMKQLRQAFCI